MKTLEQAILGPIRSELIGHNAIFYSHGNKVVTENITDVDLDGYGKFITVTADKITYKVLEPGNTFNMKQYRFHISSSYTVTE